MFRGVLIISVLLSMKLFAITKIDDIKLNKRDNGYDIIVSFNREYKGTIARKSGNSIQKVIINDAIAPRSFSKYIEDSDLLTKIDLFPFDNRTDIAFSLLKRADISYYSIDYDRGIVISVVELKENLEEISPEGKSLFSDLPSGYIGTLLLLSIGVIILLFVKKKMEKRRSSGGQTNQDLDWLLNRNQKFSLKTIQQPDFELKVRKNPNSKKPEFEKDKNRIDREKKIPDFGNLKRLKKESVENENIEDNETRDLQEEKKDKNSSHVKVIFNDMLEIGEVSMIEIGSCQYLILKERESGKITLLDKIKLENLDHKEKQQEKKVIKDSIKEFQTSKELKVEKDTENIKEKPKIEEKKIVIDKEFDIKLPDEVTENSKDLNDENELKNLFKDSGSLKL